MQTKMILIKEPIKQIIFPCLMVCSNDGEIVVLAQKVVEDGNFGGTLLFNSSPEPYELYLYEEDWCLEDFDLFHGSITIDSE